MLIFHSMPEVTVYITIVIYLLLLLGLREDPFRAAGAFVQQIFTSHKYMLHFVVVIAILFFNKFELSLEKWLNYHADFTPSIYHFEGDFVYYIQHWFENGVLTWFATFFYVVIFPTLMIVSIGIYTYQRKYRLFYAVCYAMMFNYLIAIPFYLFFPVNEVWSFHPQVHFLMKEVFPTFERDYRPLSGLDNCFPSLHTSISVSMAFIALHSKNVFWRRFTLFSAGFIIFSILYLGVHWLSDTCAGILLGLFASRIALRMSSENRSTVSVFQSGAIPFLRLKERNFGD